MSGFGMGLYEEPPPADPVLVCPGCEDTGYLLDQTYGNNPASENRTVQRCDMCDIFPGDIEAAIAAATDLGHDRVRWLQGGAWRYHSVVHVPPSDACIRIATDVEIVVGH